MRSLPAWLCLLLAACSSVGADDEQRLTALQRNAGLYFDGGKYDQALGLVERGLEIDPADYKLRSMRASIWLRLSGPAAGEDQQLLDRSLAQFAELWDERSPSHHDRHVLFYYSLARQKQGMRLFAGAARVDAGTEDAVARRDELRTSGNDELQASKDLLGHLLARGELPRLCHYHLLQIAALVNDSAAILEQGQLYLEAAQKDQRAVAEERDRTTVYGYEVERRTQLANMRAEEVSVRTLLGQQLWQQREFAQALDHVDRVLTIDPTRSDDHYNRGLILKELGRVDEAKADLRTFLATTQLPRDNPKVTDAVRVLTQ